MKQIRSLPKPAVEIWGGLECTINRVQNEYFDQLDYSGHREREGDIELFAGLGLKKMRYPVLWEHHQPHQHQSINWKQTEARLTEIRSHDIDVIAGLVHHGSGPAFVDIREESFVIGLVTYAGEVAEKFPWINYYTPVNEPLTTARFCGLYGLWYPHENNDISFCRILVNECKATAQAMAAIRLVNPEAKLIQTDDLAKVHSTPALKYQAEFENQRRWLSYDLLCGKVNASHQLWHYLLHNGISEAELNELSAHPCPPDIFGVNYYLTSERYLDECLENYPAHTHGGNGQHNYADVEAVRVGTIKPDGIQSLLKEAWKRFGIPLAVTEVHLHCTHDEQMRWLKHVWDAANNLIKDDVPVLAITPWALLGSFGWDRLLTCHGGNYEAGVFDISDVYPRPTILTSMIRAYSNNVMFDHLVFNSPGWWHRACRVTYGEELIYSPVMPSGNLLAVSGMHSAVFLKICQLRCLNVIEAGDADTSNLKVWATFAVNDYMEVLAIGKPNLLLRLQGNITKSINTGLDLFLDGETGYWELTQEGSPGRSLVEDQPQLQFLAY